MPMKPWDVVVIGSGFGGAMTALPLVVAGARVLLLERGRWVDRDASAWDASAILIDGKYRSQSPYDAPRWLGRTLFYPDEAVGGKSAFYGAASLRLREADFQMNSRSWAGVPRQSSFVDWPIRYSDLAPYYKHAEHLLGVAGVAGLDPTEPPRVSGYPEPPPPYGSMAQRVARAAESLGLSPFPLPLAINFNGSLARRPCELCLTCDLFPCQIEAKNDLSVTVLPEIIGRGATLRHSTVAQRLRIKRGRVEAVDCIDTASGEAFSVPCGACVVSCGAIGSPALLLASGLGHAEPNGRLVGRYLTRHCSGIVIGLFPFKTNPERTFAKQLALTDFYFGHPEAHPPAGPWGMIQSLQTPPPEYIAAMAPFPVSLVGSKTTSHQSYLLVIGHDLPRWENRVELHTTKRDSLGLPIPRIFYKHHRRDLRVRRALYREASRILRRAGALACFRKPINTFSHALGTCRFGIDPQQAVLDPWCNFFGVPNLFVVDGSFMPSSGGVNPSLTIAANGLRVGEYLSRDFDSIA